MRTQHDGNALGRRDAGRKRIHPATTQILELVEARFHEVVGHGAALPTG
jgi:hypothetical protein